MRFGPAPKFAKHCVMPTTENSERATRETLPGLIGSFSSREVSKTNVAEWPKTAAKRQNKSSVAERFFFFLFLCFFVPLPHFFFPRQIMQRPPSRVFSIGDQVYGMEMQDNLWYAGRIVACNPQFDTYVVEFDASRNTRTLHSSQIYPFVIDVSGLEFLCAGKCVED